MIFPHLLLINIPVKSANFSFLSLQKIYVQTYVMLCYMVIYIAPLTGDYSEALCIYKMLSKIQAIIVVYIATIFAQNNVGSSTCSYFTVFRVMDPPSPLHHRSYRVWS